MRMGLLNKAQLDNSRFKAAVRGASGSGKTWWATAVAIGLHKHLGSTKPIAFWDTENALSYVLPHFKHNGIEVVELKARAFKFVDEFFDEAEASCDIAIVDSITHLWEDLVQSYLRKRNRDKMAVWDWGKVKPEWREGMLNRIINTPLHFIACGRISDIFEYVEVDGEKVLTTTGSKMSAEKNTEYEPSLTVELEKFTMTEDELKAAARAQKGGIPNLKLVRKASRFRMTVIKDRANVLGGVYEFEPYPGEYIGPGNDIWTAVKPFCEALNIGGAHKGVNLTIDSQAMFDSPDTSWQERERQRTICLEEIEAELKRNFSTKAEDKRGMIDFLKATFGTAAWTAIQALPLDVLKEKRDKVMAAFAKPAESLESKLAGLDIGVPAPAASGEEVSARLTEIYRTTRITPEHIEEAIRLTGYNVGDDPANIRALLNSKKPNDSRNAIGVLLNWWKE
jgi:hypothetical protein